MISKKIVAIPSLSNLSQKREKKAMLLAPL